MARRRAGAGLALAAIALSAAGCRFGGTTTTVTSTVTRTVTTTRTVTQASAPASACTGNQLSGTFAAVAGSQGAGQISYTLTVKNMSGTSCTLEDVPDVILVDANGFPLPTHVTGGTGTNRNVTLDSGNSATATARFSPFVAGPGDSQSGACQPKAHTLRVIAGGGGTVDVPITPLTRVCAGGALDFTSF